MIHDCYSYGADYMDYLSDKIMKRVRAHGRGKWVCTPKDFLDLGSRAAVDQALSRLVTRGHLHRVGRGLYHQPRMSRILKRYGPPSLDQAVAAIARRDGIRVMTTGLDAANRLGLTNAVQVSPMYLTDGASRHVKVGQRTIEFTHAGPKLMQWYGRPGCVVVNALLWFGRRVATNPDNAIADRLRGQLPDHVKRDLMVGISLLPAWAVPVVKQLQGDAA